MSFSGNALISFLTPKRLSVSATDREIGAILQNTLGLSGVTSKVELAREQEFDEFDKAVTYI